MNMARTLLVAVIETCDGDVKVECSGLTGG